MAHLLMTNIACETTQYSGPVAPFTPRSYRLTIDVTRGTHVADDEAIVLRVERRRVTGEGGSTRIIHMADLNKQSQGNAWVFSILNGLNGLNGSSPSFEVRRKPW